MTLTRWARWLFWLAVAFTLVMALLPSPPDVPGDPGDKVQHIMAFAVLTALASLAFPRLNPGLIFIALAGLGALIEGLQAIPSLGRDAQWADWLADSLTVLVVLSLFAAFGRRFGD